MQTVINQDVNIYNTTIDLLTEEFVTTVDVINTEYITVIEGGEVTNLNYLPSSTQGTIISSTGTDAIIPLADGVNAGLSLNNYTTNEKNKLASITAIFTTTLKTSYDNAVSWITTNGSNLLSHLTNYSNPHNVTASQIGALISETDPIFNASEASNFVTGDKAKLDALPTTTYVDNADNLKVDKTQLDGGLEGQVLTKNTDTDQDYSWKTIGGLDILTTNPTTPTIGQQWILEVNTIGQLAFNSFMTPMVRNEKIYYFCMYNGSSIKKTILN